MSGWQGAAANLREDSAADVPAGATARGRSPQLVAKARPSTLSGATLLNDFKDTELHVWEWTPPRLASSTSAKMKTTEVSLPRGRNSRCNSGLNVRGIATSTIRHAVCGRGKLLSGGDGPDELKRCN